MRYGDTSESSRPLCELAALASGSASAASKSVSAGRPPLDDHRGLGKAAHVLSFYTCPHLLRKRS